MLIVCSGPDTYRARQKYRDLVVAYKKKYDEPGDTVEVLDDGDVFSLVASRLSNQSLFASKKMVLCEGLFEKVTVKQAKQLQTAIVRDADITVVMDYEVKSPKATIMKEFGKKELISYPFDLAKGAELQRAVRDLCLRYKMDAKVVPSLIQRYQSDLWAIDTTLQVLRVIQEGQADEQEGSASMDNVFQVVDLILVHNPSWMQYLQAFDAQEVLAPTLSQLRSWFLVQEGQAQGVHPYVKQKLSRLKIADADVFFKQLLRAFAASRSSVAQGDEVFQLLVGRQDV